MDKGIFVFDNILKKLIVGCYIWIWDMFNLNIII